MKKLKILFLAVMLPLMLWGNSDAMMGWNPNNGNGGAGSYPGMGSGPGMMNGPMMQNNGNWGMMNGMAGSPVVGADGTAYFVVSNPTAKPGKTPSVSSFTSQLIAVKPSGEMISLSFNGLLSKPVVSGNALFATVSLPDMANYQIVGNGGTNPATQQSVLYALTLPLTASSVPSAVSLDGTYASVPTFANDHFYVTTTDFGYAMMQGNSMFGNVYGKYNFNKTGAAKSYLYIINPDLTIASKVQIQ